MTQKIGSIGIIKESRNDESRAPIAPEQIKEIKNKFPDIIFTFSQATKEVSKTKNMFKTEEF